MGPADAARVVCALTRPPLVASHPFGIMAQAAALWTRVRLAGVRSRLYARRRSGRGGTTAAAAAGSHGGDRGLAEALGA